METRKCTKCGETKVLTEEFFTPCKGYVSGLTRWCKVCTGKYNTEYQKRDRLKRPEFFKAREFAREMKKYGTTVEWYRDRLIAQNGLCAICEHLSHHHGTIQRLQVDHDHSCCDLHTKSCGKCLRGLLCADCNIRLAPLEATLSESQVTPNAGTWTSRALRYLAQYQVSTQETQCDI